MTESHPAWGGFLFLYLLVNTFVFVVVAVVGTMGGVAIEKIHKIILVQCHATYIRIHILIVIIKFASLARTRRANVSLILIHRCLLFVFDMALSYHDSPHLSRTISTCKLLFIGGRAGDDLRTGRCPVRKEDSPSLLARIRTPEA